MKKKKRSKNKSDADNPMLDNLSFEEAELLEPDEEEAEVLDAPEEEPSHETLYKETLDRYTRTLAEFDNFRKRSVKEKAAQYDDGKRAAAEKLLPIVDNFERAMLSSEGTHGEDTFYQGIALIARQFTQVLQELNVEEIPAKAGDDFDTAIHYAVAHEENKDFGANQVSLVLQKGYIYKGKVLRYCMVKVAN
jgi:molecular chaperone GrpE